jgi:hypothetical protein
MGIEWRTGSKYSGPYGTVYWLLLENRSSNNAQVLYLATELRNLPYRILAGDNPYTPPPPDPTWSFYVDERVVAWNGGPSDLP